MHWSRWTYNDWNDRLIEYYFEVGDGSLDSTAVTRIPATPEELAVIAGVSAEEAIQVVEVFVKCVVRELPQGVSFCGFCYDVGDWTDNSAEAPHFFAMLWFTCLVAYGYPSSEGSFAERVSTLLGKADNFRHHGRGGLRELWERLASWTQKQQDAGNGIRNLDLPPPGHRKVIGHSYYLAFPNRADRTSLGRLLLDAGLVGFEPPVQPVLSTLLNTTNVRLFSADFVKDLGEFRDQYARGEDPRESPFWRAVRQEALAPVTGPSSASGERAVRTWLLFVDNEQGLIPLIGCKADQGLPEGFEAHRFEEPIHWPAYVTGADGDMEVVWQAAFEEGRLLPIGLRKLIAQGLLVLRESRSGEYEVVHGSDIHGCQRALVRSQLRDPFLKAFGGGSPQQSLVDGWHEVEACKVRQLDVLPAGLHGVTQLLRTMNPPSLALVGGVRTDGGFLFNSRFLPRVRALGVQSVVALTPDGNKQCTPIAGDPGDWDLPRDLTYRALLTLRASWSMDVGGTTVSRTSEAQFRLTRHVINDKYRGKPSGSHFVESCPEPETDVANQLESPLGITTNSAALSSDLLEFDASARFLGPGLGEMVLERQEGFDWLVVGKKKAPELLVFVGDVAHPAMPAQRQSESKGNRRHWRQAFNARRLQVRSSEGQYIPIDQAPSTVKTALSAFRNHKVEGIEVVPVTALDKQLDQELPRATPDPATNEAADILAAIGSRRKGLTYSEVRDVFGALLGRDNPIEMQQILRGWTEAGLVDILRSAQVSRFVIVPRRPRLVMIQRGPTIEATVVGLITSVRQQQIETAIRATGSTDNRQDLLPANCWQPSTIRIRGDLKTLEEIQNRAELGPSEWLLWPSTGTPACLDISEARSRLNTGPPPASFRFDAGWDWSRTSFFRGHRDSESVRLERRVHRDSSTIYVLLRDDMPILWTYSRSWALLEAYAARGTPAFRAEGRVLSTTGRAPVHLPLPVGRLCVLIGEGLPGPTLGESSIRYSYPFGPRLFRLVERVVPPEWIDTSSLPLPNWSPHAGPDRKL